MYATVLAKIPGVATPWTKRHAITWGSVVEVAASAVASVNIQAEPTITRRRPSRSASRPTIGAKIATATVGAVIVRPASKVDAPKVRVKSGSSGWVQ